MCVSLLPLLHAHIYIFARFVPKLFPLVVQIESTKDLAQALRSYFFLYMPPYNLGEGLLNLPRAYYANFVQVPTAYVTIFLLVFPPPLLVALLCC